MRPTDVPPVSRRQLLTGLALGSTGLLLPPGLAAAEPGQLLRLAARPENYEAPLSALAQRLTPVGSFYIRSHHDNPSVDAQAWRLVIDGLAARPLALSLADLARFPSVEVEAVLQCSGNGRALFHPRMPGAQWQRGAMGNALWRGVRLADVLAKAGPKKAARHVILRGADRALMPKQPSFVRTIPLEKALHPDTLIATHMNGAPLTASHGFPARLVVPGWVGDDWIKWLSTLTLSETEGDGFYIEKAYRFPDPPGAPGEAMPPERMKPMTRMKVKSVIVSPEASDVVRAGPVTVVGVAFSGEATLRKVEVSTDGEQTWQAAELEGPPSPYGWQLFRAQVQATPGRLRLASRATDARGDTQPATPVWNPSGYLYNAIDPVELEVKA